MTSCWGLGHKKPKIQRLRVPFAEGLSVSLCLCGWLSLRLASHAEVIDRLMAVVDRQIITLGDVEEELKFQEVDPRVTETGLPSAARSQKLNQELALQRLIEQTLIRQQIRQFPGVDVTDDEIDAQLAEMQKKAGGAAAWTKALEEHGVALEPLRERVRWQLEVMRFIDYRFRQFIVVDSNEIEAYYKSQFLQDLRQRGVQPQLPLAEVEEKIREILTEEKLNVQVEEWLASLRTSAAIEVFH